MQISVSGKQVDISDALRVSVEDGLTQVVEKYFDNALDAQAVFSRNGHLFHADISLHVGRGILLRGSGENGDAYQALASAIDHMGKRLRRYKRRLRDHRRTPDDTRVLKAQQYILAEPDYDDAETDGAGPGAEPVVVAEMSTEIPSLTVSEAVMRMTLADLPAMLFRNAAHDGLNMVYRRPDGNVGWVDPRGVRERTR